MIKSEGGVNLFATVSKHNTLSAMNYNFQKCVHFQPAPIDINILINQSSNIELSGFDDILFSMKRHKAQIERMFIDQQLITAGYKITHHIHPGNRRHLYESLLIALNIINPENPDKAADIIRQRIQRIARGIKKQTTQDFQLI